MHVELTRTVATVLRSCRSKVSSQDGCYKKRKLGCCHRHPWQTGSRCIRLNQSRDWQRGEAAATIFAAGWLAVRSCGSSHSNVGSCCGSLKLIPPTLVSRVSSLLCPCKPISMHACMHACMHAFMHRAASVFRGPVVRVFGLPLASPSPSSSRATQPGSTHAISV